MKPTVTTASRPRAIERIRLLTCVFAGLFFLLGGAVHDVQAQRTITIEPGFGTINDAIMGDTTATGERVDANTVYVLRGGLSVEDRYYLNGSILTTNYHLQVQAEEGSTVPPVLQVLTDETGVSAGTFIEAEGDVTLRGLYMLGMDDLDAPRSQHVIMNGDDKHLVVDDCFIDYNRFIVFRFNGENGNLRLTNSHIRNVLTTNNPGNGKVVDGRGTNLESVYVENNTFEGVSGEFTRLSGGLMRNLFFHHNTVYNMHAFVRDDFRENSGKVVEARIANNLFINTGWVGDTLNTANPPSNWEVGIFAFDSLSVVPELTEEDRDIHISRNNFFWEPELMDFFNSGFTATCEICSGGTVKQYPIFSPRGQLFVDDGLIRFDNAIEEDPEFGLTSGVSGFIDWVEGYWTEPANVSATMVYFDPDGTNSTEDITDWPVTDDFTYPTTKASFTAGSGGFPLGDLNWFPESKAEWEAQGGGTGIIVSREDNVEFPEGFILRGNYPNPFNPSTTIRFDLPSPADVRIHVYDLLGRELMALPAGSMESGANRTVEVDAGSLPSGVYLYRVFAESPLSVQTLTGRMVLLK